jgi:type VI secretion system secreted protein VgrG
MADTGEEQARPADTADFTFKAGSLDADELRVTGFSGTEALSELFHFHVDLCSDEAEIPFDEVVGKAALLEIHGSFGTRYVNGIVQRFEARGQSANLFHYAADIVPLHWLLTKRYKSRIFQDHNCSDMTVPGIIRKVLEDAGIPEDNFRFALQGEYDSREYVVQYRESEMDFISRLMEAEGIFYFFEHTADGHKMVFGDSPTAHADTPNESLFAYREKTGLVTEASQEYVHHVRDRQEIQTGAVALDDYNFQQPPLELMTTTSADQYTSLEHSDYPGKYMDKGVGEHYVQVRLEEFQWQRHVLKMHASVRAWIPGFEFTIKEHPTEALNSDYVVTRLTHQAAQPQAAEEEAGAAIGLQYLAQIDAIPADIPFRPPRVTPKPRVHGSQTALVTGPTAEEIYTDKYGRVKVHFHWDREGKHDENASCWIRVSHGWAGGQYGMIFLPRVGQEVIVDFLEGDPDKPIITGRVYNGDCMPPYGLPDEKTKATIKGHSSKGGGGTNEIRFEDLKGEEQLFIQAQRQMDTNVKASHFHSVGGSYHVKVGGKESGSLYELIHEDKHVHVKNNVNTLTDADESHEVKGKVSIKIGGTRSTDVARDVIDKFGSSHKHEVSMTYALKALAVKIEASTCIELKCGGSSIVLTPAAIFVMGGPLVNINCGAGPPVGPVTAMATSPDPADDASGADKSDPGKDVRYDAAQYEFEPLDIEPGEEPAPEEEEEEKTWVEVELVNDIGEPVASEPCWLKLPSGREIRRTTDANGVIRVTGIDPGECDVNFYRRDREAWERD